MTLKQRKTAMLEEQIAPTIDWSRPIETVDGETRHVIKRDHDSVYIGPLPDDPRCKEAGGEGLWYSTSTGICVGFPTKWGWVPKLRNVVEITVAERMEAFIRNLAKTYSMFDLLPDTTFGKQIAELRAIVADLPELVDPDLIEARKIAAACFLESGQNADASLAEQGGCDSWSTVRAALAGIKHARATGPRP